MILKMRPVPEFSVTQHIQGKSCLELVNAALGNKGVFREKSGSPHVLELDLTNIIHLIDTVITFLEVYNANSARKVELNLFKTVCYDMQAGKHLTKAGLSKIIGRLYDTPMKKGKRLHDKAALLSILDSVV